VARGSINFLAGNRMPVVIPVNRVVSTAETFSLFLTTAVFRFRVRRLQVVRKAVGPPE
jgi:hypothetical protein